MKIFENENYISIINESGTEFRMTKHNKEVFLIVEDDKEDTSTAGMYHIPKLDERVCDYVSLKTLGKFTDPEITLIRLRIGEIANWNQQWKERMQRALMTTAVT